MNTNKENRCAFLMSSCDAYKDIWTPFFQLMQVHWNKIPYPIYVNTESESLENINRMNFDFKVKSCNLKKNPEDKNTAWGGRMLNALDQIEEEYVLLVLDDFFICESAQTDVIENILNIMDKDPSIASFQLSGSRTQKDSGKIMSDEFSYKLIDESGWKTHFVPTIWRKSVLKKWLRPYESIWGFELYGSNRARRWKYEEKVYIVESPAVYNYMWINGCSVVLNGRWLDDPEVDKTFRDNNLKVDYSKRGKITIQEYKNITNKDLLKKYSPSEIVEKSFNRVRSFF